MSAVYLLLFAGIFMGWSLGTNDGANAFGTAVATGVVKYRTAIIIIAIFVILGAFLQGDGNLTKVSELATANEVMPSESSVQAAIAAGSTDDLVLKAAIKAAIVFTCAGITVFIMSYLNFPVSANQSITGAIVGWGLVHADYSTPQLGSQLLSQLGKFASTWLLNPLGAAIISFIIIKLANVFLIPRLTRLTNYDKMVKAGYLIAGAFASYSIGMNSSANVTALYYDAIDDSIQTNLLTNGTLAATIGGIAIAIGVLTYSKKVMMTVGSAITPLTQIEGFLVIIAMALTIVIMGSTMGIPVSTSQAVVGAVVGAGLTKGRRCVNYSVFENIVIAWVSSPVGAGLLTYLVALATKTWLA